MTTDEGRAVLTPRRWCAVQGLVFALLYLAGVVLFVFVAERLDNEFAAKARSDHLGLVVWTHVGLLPAYLAMWAVHTALSWPLARRLAARRARRRAMEWRPGVIRLFLTSVVLNVAVFALSLGPVSYVSTGSLDVMARTVAAAWPSANVYVFKTWHLQEVFTAAVALLALLALLDLYRWMVGRMARWRPLPRGGVIVLGGVGLGVAICLPFVRPPEVERKSVERFPNVIVLASDSLRWDHLSCHGYHRPTSPNIDRVVREAFDFQQLHVSTASTLESWTTLLTGRYPARHGLRYMFINREQAERVSRDGTTLPRVLRRLGYESSVVADWAGNCFSLVDYGFDRTLASDVQNLDVFLSEVAFRTHPLVTHYFSHTLGELLVPHMRQATGYMNPEHLTHEFLGELDAASAKGKPFFGVLFLSCTHLPFGSSYPFNQKFVDPEYRGPNRFHVAFDVDDFIQNGFPDEVPLAEKQHIVDLYDGGVAQFDHYVGLVMDHLERTGLTNNTVVVITSDHGEDLYEPGTTLGHGTNFFGGDQSTRIPMIVRPPGGFLPGAFALSDGRRVPHVTRGVDFMPTVLDIIGRRKLIGELDMDGKSLEPYMLGEPRDLELAAFAETCYLFYPKRVPGEDVYAMEPADRTLDIDPGFRNQFVLKPEYHDYVIDTKDRMMRTDRWKLIYIKGKRGPIYRFFDMVEDPSQTTDLSRQGFAVMDEMKESLKRWMETGEDQPWPRARDSQR